MKYHQATPLAVVIVAAVYFCLGKLGLSLTFLNGSAAAVYPASGFALAMVLLLGPGIWPGILVASVALDCTNPGLTPSLMAIFLNSAGNTFEPIIGASLISRLARGRNAMEQPADILKFVLLAGALTPLISATFYSASLAGTGAVPWHYMDALWLTRWTATALSNLVIAPLILIWANTPFRRLTRSQIFEALVLISLLFVLGQLVFGGWLPFDNKNLPLSYLLIPILLWAGFRFGQRGAPAAGFAVTVAAIWGTAQGFGPFASDHASESLLLVQAFLGTLVVTALIVVSVASEKKRTEQALEEAEQQSFQIELRRAAILESAFDAIITMDEKGRIVDFNPAAERMFTRKRAEVTGNAATSVLFPKWLARTGNGILHCFGQTPPFESPGRRFETMAQRADGSEFDVDLAITSTRVPSGEMFLTACIRDISERKRTERALQQAQEQLRRHAEELEQRVIARTSKLSQTIRTLESFSYSVAHDLRAPLRAMHGWAMVLEEDYGNVLDATGRGYTGRIADSATKMDHLIQDLLNYSYMSHKQCSCSLLSLDSQFRTVLAQLTTEIGGANATIDLEHDLPDVFANGPMLQQALRNLISNAIKFVPEDTLPVVKIRTEESDTHVRIWIHDNGIGIAPEHHEKIFGVFERLHSSEAYSGTGIGLAIVHKSIERMGGRVGVQSAKDQGASFWIDLPKTKTPNPEAGDEEPENSPPVKLDREKQPNGRTASVCRYHGVFSRS